MKVTQPLAVYYHGYADNTPVHAGRLAYTDGIAHFEYSQAALDKNINLSELVTTSLDTRRSKNLN